MPHLHLSHTPAPGHHPQAPTLARQLTSLTAKHLRKEAGLTAVEIQSKDPAHWFIGAESLADQGLGSYHLRIAVTQGTNTEAEMAQFLAAVHATLQTALGPLHEASYTVVDELPAAHWGYEGRSQAERRAVLSVP